MIAKKLFICSVIMFLISIVQMFITMSLYARADTLSQAIERYKEVERSIIRKALDAYENGTQYHFSDTDIEIRQISSNRLAVNLTVLLYNESSWGGNFLTLVWRWVRYKIPYYNVTFYPNATISDFYRTLYRLESRKRLFLKSGAILSLSPAYFLVNGNPGEIVYFSYNQKPSYQTLVSLAESDPMNIFKVNRTWMNAIFVFEFNDSLTEPFCLVFPVPRYSRVHLKMSFWNDIIYHRFDYPEFIINGTKSGNRLEAWLKPYPCCGEKNVKLQPLEVCVA